MSVQSTLSVAAGAVGGFVSYAFGGWSGLLEIFFLAIALDFISGIAASIFEGKGLASAIGFKGLMKKTLMILSVVFAHRIDLALGTNMFYFGFLTAWLVNEFVSIGENYGRTGLPLSEYLNPIISILKQKGEGK
jgi:toxin secretion/phage lysis holin